MPLPRRSSARSTARLARGAAALFALWTGGCAEVVVDTDSSVGGGAGTSGSDGGSTTTPCACATDTDCPSGTVCELCACVPGCSPQSPCAAPLTCCNNECVDTQTDPNNCGGCFLECSAPNATMGCKAGQCTIAGCDAGFADCDLVVGDGCEWQGPCPCLVGDSVACYSGPAGTAGVGLCISGIQSCVGGVQWSDCVGQVLPMEGFCDGLDHDCDGQPDNADLDGDGWTACDGDCCETLACSDKPHLVNPGAFEVPGNGIDDDCNAVTPDGAPFPTCAGPALDAPTSSMDLIKAMDICQFTVESPAFPKDKTWGLISAAITLADGTAAVLPKDLQAGVLAGYGPNVLPKYGTTMAALATGTARAEGDPGFVYPQNGYLGGQIGNFIAGTQVPVPADYLAANGGKVPTPCGACVGASCTTAFDSIALKLRMRTPTNADSFRYHVKFYSAEYPDNVCQEYNDFFVALLDSQYPDTPPDKNVAVDASFNPLSVNNVFFQVCASPLCPLGTAELVGTGMGGWDGTLVDGAGTGWLEEDVPIVPGETIELRFIIWEAVDGNVDSLALLDAFRWDYGPEFIVGP